MEVAQAQLEALAGGQGVVVEDKRTTLKEAVDLYMGWRDRERTNNKIYAQMTGKLLQFCTRQNILHLDEVTPAILTKFKSTLKYKNHLDGSDSMKIHWMTMTAFFCAVHQPASGDRQPAA